MTKRIKISELSELDATEYLTTVLEENDPALLAAAIGDIAREALYKALRPGSEPRFGTISRVCAAFLVAQPIHLVQ